MIRISAAALALGFAFVTAWGAGPARSQQMAPTAATSPAQREAEVDAIMAPWRDKPGAAILVIRDGRVLLSKGYGLANVETGAPIRSDTVFELASVSKQFTAMAILILADRGALSLDDPLTRFFPEFPAYAQKITVRNLLTHTGGLPDYMDAFKASGRINKDNQPGGFEPTSADALELLSEQAKPDFSAGDRFTYSNSGYMVLAQIVGKASGKPFPQFMKDSIFTPLGMKHTVIGEDAVPRIPYRALSYEPKDGGFKNIDYTPINRIYGDGSVNTTIEDMVRWDQALYTEKLIKAATLKEAFSSGELSNGEQTHYGFGWFINKLHGLDEVSHSGGWVGFRTQITRYPEAHYTVAVLSNLASFRPDDISRQIVRIYMPERFGSQPAVELAPSALMAFVGDYDMGTRPILHVTVEAGVLRAQQGDVLPMDLAPSAPTIFYAVRAENVTFTFNRNAQGEVESVTLGSGRTGKKVR